MWFAAFEEYAVFVLLAGLVLVAVGWIALLVRAFQASKIWGFGVLIIPPLAFLFIPTHYATARRAMLVIFFGLILVGSPYAVNFLGRWLVDLGPWEKQVNGELHLTLTGWDRKDYAVLKAKPQAVVLQMANPDVTDATLDYIAPMAGLRELDLNGAPVTDAGLVKLQDFKKLETLRLRGTKITDDAFKVFLRHMEGLKELDVRNTAVKADTIIEWRKGGAGRRANFDRPPSARPTATQLTATQPTAPRPSSPVSTAPSAPSAPTPTKSAA